MAYKILGQSNPAATTNTDVYTCPAGKMFVCSSIWICNQSTTAAQVRIAIRPDGATLSAVHYILYDVWIDGLYFGNITTGMTGDAADVITVRASTANLSFTFFGDEA